MLISMTGHGDARWEHGGVQVAVEVRAVNSRYFKLTLRGDDTQPGLESRIEEQVRHRVRRGTINMVLRIERQARPVDYRINQDLLCSYHQQLSQLPEAVRGTQELSVGPLLGLPGVVEEPWSAGGADQTWELIQPAVTQALTSLQAMREAEGRAMQQDFEQNLEAISRQLLAIRRLAPEIARSYQSRLTERINKLLEEYHVSLQPSDLVREVAVFAERADISEETVRLESHLGQFHAIMNEAESTGRKLEFLIQEMFREANTIGSKANSAEIALYVVEIKTHIERMREMIQNVE